MTLEATEYIWHNPKLGEFETRAGLEPTPAGLSHSVLYQPITFQFRYNQEKLTPHKGVIKITTLIDVMQRRAGWVIRY